MADVFHHYVGRGKAPKPTAAQSDREKSRAELLVEQTRERRAKAEIAEMEMRQRKRELIERSDVLRQASFIMSSIKGRLLSLPTPLSRRLVGGKTQHEMRMIIGAAVRECLEDLADFPNKVTEKQWSDFIEAEEA
jgi:phage terminase Nu1 subunit (DNA packaging protein)